MRPAEALSPDASLRLRPPSQVMRLARLGAFHQTRLSFMRVLLRRLAADGWAFARTRFELDARGEGMAVYEAHGGGQVYALVAFAHDLPPEKRTDRVIAEAWDATFALVDGAPNAADLERLSRNVPLQEAGRCSAAELVLARANRSVRLFEHVGGRLAAGSQPEPAEIDAVGYLMRTTAVYGNGKFGLADRARIADRPAMAGAFAAEMLTVWLIRAFTVDMAEHMAAVRAPGRAVRLDPRLRRRLGVGNSTGLGMAPFLVNHPGLLDRWITARETALARVRAVGVAEPERQARFLAMLGRARRHAAAWNVADEPQTARIAGLRVDLERLALHIAQRGLAGTEPWDALYRWAEAELELEAQELLVTLLLEPYGDLVDDLAAGMAGDEAPEQRIDGAMDLATLAAAIDTHYGFALDVDFSRPEAQARFWYTSEEKLEPRLGERFEEPGAEREQPLAVARDVQGLRAALQDHPPEASVAAFLMAEPRFRHTVRRVQATARRPYAEIRDNLIDASLRPIDILRCKLAFFGATRFDPRSDRWVRITMFQHAPFPDELAHMPADDWAIPPLEAWIPPAAGA